MSTYKNTISKKGKVYEIYHTRNPVLLFLRKKFLNKTAYLLQYINAASLKGLDIGCSEGHMMNILSEKGVINDITGVDLDKERIDLAKKQYPALDFQVGDIYDLKSSTEIYDYIIATEILEHLPDPEAALTMLRSVAEHNSYIIISVPNEPYFSIGNCMRGKYWHRRGRTPAHVNFWSRKQFKIFLQQNHIDIVKQYSLSTFPWLLYLGKFK